MADEKSLSPIRLDPKDVLNFALAHQVSPQTALTIYNTTESEYLTFKVKTTRPMRYLVRPNQGLIGPGGSATIVVILQQKDCTELLQLDMDEQQSMNDKFLVQAALVDTEFATSVAENKNPKDVTEALTQKWTTLDKKDTFSKKLKCRFTKTPTTTSTPDDDVQEAKGLDDGLGKQQTQSSSTQKKSVMFQVDAQSTSSLKLAAASTTSASTRESSSSADSIQEVANLRKKYDELVAFTVRLTSQRDSLVTELDKTRSQLKKKSISTDAELESTTGLRQRRSMTGSSTHQSASDTSTKSHNQHAMNSPQVSLGVN